MKNKLTLTTFLAAAVLTAFLHGCGENGSRRTAASGRGIGQEGEKKMAYPVTKTEEEWRKILTPEQYRVMREKGTERPFTGKYDKHNKPGVYKCAACGQELFSSETKFESHCGWPSYFKPLEEEKVEEKPDSSHGMVRTEVVCSNCGAHLGHVFEDGPRPTGLRYCINSVALDFEKKGAEKEQGGEDK